MAVHSDTEIRHLSQLIKDHLSSLLDIKDFWIEMVKHITYPDGDSGLLFNTQHVNTIKQMARGQACSPTTLVLNEWGTFGRKRPTVDDLITLLRKCDHFQAVNYLVVNVLHGVPENNDSISTTELLRDIIPDRTPYLEPIPVNMPYHDSDSFQTGPGFTEGSFRDSYIPLSLDSSVQSIQYAELFEMTDEFNIDLLSAGGRLLGRGAFSAVFLGVNMNSNKFAVKRIENSNRNQFATEYNVLSRLSHKNVLKLLGYAEGPQCYCLIFEYASNGSLLDRLQLQQRNPSLPWFTRLTIALGIAQGLVVVHTNDIVHKDVKSANVMLGDGMEPKLGDFGVAHRSPNVGATHIETITVAGTMVYMPREAHHGIISFKWDTYSFGVVLLELLSGKKPFDHQTTVDLVSYFEEHCVEFDQLPNVLDASASWNLMIAKEIFEISQKCLANNREYRPEMVTILQNFKELVEKAYKLTRDRSNDSFSESQQE